MDNIDVSSTANLYKSLAQAAPEIKQCVDACNFIAESTRQQNNFGSVSVTLTFKLYLPVQLFTILIMFWMCLFIPHFPVYHFLSCYLNCIILYNLLFPNEGNWKLGSDWEDDWQGVFLGCLSPLHHRYSGDLLNRTLQPGTWISISWAEQKISPELKKQQRFSLMKPFQGSVSLTLSMRLGNLAHWVRCSDSGLGCFNNSYLTWNLSVFIITAQTYLREHLSGSWGLSFKLVT